MIITPIVKPVSAACNIRCEYCYHKERRNYDYPVMPNSVLEALTRGFVVLKQPRVRFIWHGGEPLLAGIPFYEKALEFQRVYFSSDCRVINSFQTNGIGINKKWAEFFKANRFRIGISVDGPEFLHDHYRKFKNGTGTFQGVLKAIRILQRHNVPLGVITVVTKVNLSYPKEIFDLFYKNNLFRLNFSPAGDFDAKGRLLDYSLSPNEWGEFLIRIFDIWLERDDPRVRIQLLDSFLQGLIGGKPEACVCQKDCTNFISIDSDGSVYFCGRFLGNPDFLIGNLSCRPLSEILNGPELRKISERVSQEKEECFQCEWSKICNGGCPSHRYKHNQGLTARYYFCESTKMILTHMRFRISECSNVIGPFLVNGECLI